MTEQLTLSLSNRKINVNIRIGQIVETGYLWKIRTKEGWETELLLHY